MLGNEYTKKIYPLLIGLTVLVPLIFMIIFFNNHPAMEEFGVYDLYFKFQNNGFTLAPLFDYQSNHIPILNRLLYLTSIHTFNDSFLILILSFICTFISAYLTSQLISISNPRKELSLLLSSIFFFCFIHYEFFMHAWLIMNIQEILLGLLFFYSIKKNSSIGIGTSLFLSLFTLISWITLIPFILIEIIKYKNKKMFWFIPIICFGIFLYRGALHSDPFHQELYLNIWDNALFTLAMIGKISCSTTVEVLVSFGFLSLVLFCLLIRKGMTKFEFYIATWALLHPVMTSIGRSGTGLAYANQSRYFIYLVPFFIVLAQICYKHFKLERIESKFILILMAFYLWTYIQSYNQMRRYVDFKEQTANCYKGIQMSQGCSFIKDPVEFKQESDRYKLRKSF